jgi:hypothetical protein
MEEETYGVSGTNPNKELMGALAMLAKSSSGGQKAFDAASAMYAPVEEANPWEASLRFFLEMGKQASQPGATVLGSAVGSGLVPLDYLTAKKKEKRDRDQKVASTAMSLAPSLAPKAATYRDPKEYMIEIPVLDDKGKPTGAFQPAYRDFLTAKGFADLQKQGARFKSVDKTTGTGSTFKERKFYKTGFDPAVVKNENDAADFEAQGWSSVPPVDWTDSKGATSEDAAEVQSSKILDSGVVVTVMKDGTSKVLDGAGNELTGDARTDAIRIAEERGIELQGDRSGARRAAVVGVDTALSAFEKVGQIRTNISNLNEAKRLVVEEGANTGVIESLLPSWRASTIELQNVRSSLGLDVVGSVTFGALSAGELNLALNTALPTNLQEEALADWLDRKIDAQQKLSEYLTRQAVYLSDGDKTVGDWLRFEKEYQEKRERQEAEQRQSGTNYDFTNMSAAELNEIDVSTLTDDQFDAWEARMDELGL